MLAGVESNLRSDQAVASNAAYVQSGPHIMANARKGDNQTEIVYIFPCE